MYINVNIKPLGSWQAYVLPCLRPVATILIVEPLLAFTFAFLLYKPQLELLELPRISSNYRLWKWVLVMILATRSTKSFLLWELYVSDPATPTPMKTIFVIFFADYLQLNSSFSAPPSHQPRVEAPDSHANPSPPTAQPVTPPPLVALPTTPTFSTAPPTTLSLPAAPSTIPSPPTISPGVASPTTPPVLDPRHLYIFRSLDAGLLLEKSPRLRRPLPLNPTRGPKLASLDRKTRDIVTEMDAGDEDTDGDVENPDTDNGATQEPPNKEAMIESLDEEASADSSDERQSESEFEPLTPTPTVSKPIAARTGSEGRVESLVKEASADSPDERQSESEFEPLTPTPTAPKPIRERLIDEIDSCRWAPAKTVIEELIVFDSTIPKSEEIDTQCRNLECWAITGQVFAERRRFHL